MIAGGRLPPKGSGLLPLPGRAVIVGGGLPAKGSGLLPLVRPAGP